MSDELDKNNSNSFTQCSYNYVMEYVTLTIEREEAIKEDNLLFLRYMLDSIGRDIETDTLLRGVYADNGEAPRGSNVFPLTVKPIGENSIFFCSADSCNYKLVDLSKDIVITEPWRRKNRLYNLLSCVDKYGFIYDKRNHRGVFFPYMNITIVSQGNHSISCAKFLKKGFINACVYDIETAFKYIDTDGQYWVFIGCENNPKAITDFRYALMYKLAKLYYQISNSND